MIQAGKSRKSEITRPSPSARVPSSRRQRLQENVLHSEVATRQMGDSFKSKRESAVNSGRETGDSIIQQVKNFEQHNLLGSFRLSNQDLAETPKGLQQKKRPVF